MDKMKKENKYDFNIYDFNICIKCQKMHKDIPCSETCKYLEEYSQSRGSENMGHLRDIAGHSLNTGYGSGGKDE